MSETLIGVIGIAALFLFLVARLPVGMALLVVGFGGIWFIGGQRAAIATLSSETYSSVTGYSLSIIPLFVLMGNMAGAAGYSQRLYEAANAWIGRLRGGLASATVVGCAAFAAVSGSSVADCGDYRQSCAAADETLWLCGRSGDRGGRCGRDTRHTHSAVDRLRTLRNSYGRKHRQTVYSWNSSRNSPGDAFRVRDSSYYFDAAFRRPGWARRRVSQRRLGPRFVRFRW